jgi:hypothetical protein
MFLTIESVKVGTDIKLAKNANRALDGELASMTNTAVTLDSLKKQITDLKENTALIDSLTQNTTKWAELFERLSDAYAEIGPFCITKVETPTNKRLVAEMKVENREQVAKLERFIPKSIISNVYTAEENSRFITVKIECYFD